MLELLLRHREVARLKTVVDGLLPLIDDHGRIHTTFNQTIAATGRLSSTDPNLQNIPVRTAEGRRIREAFTVGAGYESLMTADYSQIEMRIMAHLSARRRADRGVHDRRGPAHLRRVARVRPAARADRPRAAPPGQGDVLRAGLRAVARSGWPSSSRSPPDEARGQMEAYFARFGGVRDYLRSVVEDARQTGYTETIMGRRRYLPNLTSDNRKLREMAERMALNAPIQGSAADIIKVAMLGVHRGLADAGLRSRLLLQVHDELVLEIAPGEREQVEELVRARDGRRLPARRAARRLGRRRAAPGTTPPTEPAQPVGSGRYPSTPARSADRRRGRGRARRGSACTDSPSVVAPPVRRRRSPRAAERGRGRGRARPRHGELGDPAGAVGEGPSHRDADHPTVPPDEYLLIGQRVLRDEDRVPLLEPAVVVSGHLGPAGVHVDQPVSGTRSGAPFVIQVPSDKSHWNGTLLLWSHGYRAAAPVPSNPLNVNQPDPGRSHRAGRTDLPTANALLAQGFALAGSAGATNGWDDRDGVRADQDLYKYFSDTFGTPKRVYLWGESLGALTAETLAETHPDGCPA